ncbi:hypothetical protein HPB49_010063 [Dermacentor silvarum]|uniref:Uncharacterized protein n=1 Tax=Dermacentor silvarum TaxID=543639 RepID=A0ACB8DZB6_DERSI|nr:hypothetical protein HPB49_010063 [Dermacentor silvarum]
MYKNTYIVEALAKNEKKKTETEDLNQLLFRPVQKVEKGADPKSVLCAFFKQGTCGKGDKCKFSHDLTIERKAEKRDIYTDMRDQDTMDNWDEAKLAEVVEKKHGEAERRLPKTDIICKHFLDALEQNKYGWFWECPNGGQKCHYRHAVPPGFVLLNKAILINKLSCCKSKARCILHLLHYFTLKQAKIGGNLPRITLESFLAWKKAKIREKQDTEQKERDRKRDEFKAGRSIGLSGRDMFTFRPELAEDDGQDEEGEEAYDLSRFDGEEDNVEVIREITLENLMAESLQSGDLAAAAASPIEASMATSVPIDEKLFEDDDLEDLEELEDELEELAIK